MRRSLPLLLLALAGCGGGGESLDAAQPIFRVSASSPEFQDVSGGFDAQGEPVGIVYDERTETAQISSFRGNRSVSLKGKAISFGLWVDDGIANFWTFDGENVSGGLLLDTASERVWTIDEEELFSVGEGSRFLRAEGTQHSIWDFRTDRETSLPLPEGWHPAGLAGDVVLAGKDEGPIPGTKIIDMGAVESRRARRSATRGAIFTRDEGDNTIHHYAYRTYTSNGVPIVDLAVPEGMTFVSIAAMNAQGEAVGFAYPQLSLDHGVLVRWDRYGIPTVLAPQDDDMEAVSIAWDGRILIRNAYSSTVRAFVGTTEKRFRLNVRYEDDVTFSPDGHTAFVYRSERHDGVFYRLP